MMTQNPLFPDLEPAVPDGNCHWYTPKDIIALAHQILGSIDLDPCSCEAANRVVQATAYYSPERGQDGLSLPWPADTLWLNPPYGAGVVDRWINRLIKAVDEGETEHALVLTNNSTATQWWQRLANRSTLIYFHDERIQFWGPLERGSQPFQGQTLCLVQAGGRDGDTEIDRYPVVRRMRHLARYGGLSGILLPGGDT